MDSRTCDVFLKQHYSAISVMIVHDDSKHAETVVCLSSCGPEAAEYTSTHGISIFRNVDLLPT